MRRKIYSELMSWKNRPGHKCLVVSGQRQVGKTYIIRSFAEENYAGCAYIDFNLDPSAKKLFSRDLNVDRLILNIEQYLDIEITEDTLIVLDEIQECNDARSALKYFSADGRYDVIASGSLLGVRFPAKNDDSEHLIPVGYEEHLIMYSMDFEEFLWANDVKESAIEDIRNSLKERTPINEALLSKYESAYRDYLIIGGMPASVAAFVTTGGFRESGRILHGLIQSCREDITRYCPANEKIKTLECFDSIPIQLSKSNKKFIFSDVSGESSRKAMSYYSENLLWIEGAGYGNFCRSLDGPILPLISHEIPNSFKIYLSDTGMLVHMFDRDLLRAVYEGDTSYNFGAIIENAVAEALMKSNYRPRSYKKNAGRGRMEIDFVIVLGDELTAIEVKSGRSRDSPSIDKVDSQFKVARKIKFQNSNIYVKNDVEHYPLFAACFIDSLIRDYDGPDF